VVANHDALLGLEVGSASRVHRGCESLVELMPMHHGQAAQHDDALVGDILNVEILKVE